MFAKIRSFRTAGFVVDLLMLVVGINIALWFEGQFEDYQDAKAQTEYVAGLKRDILEDAASLERLAETNAARAERLAAILEAAGRFSELPQDNVIGMMFEVSTYDFFEPEDFTYRAMQESGDFRLLSDADLKEALLRQHRRYRLIATLEANFLQALDDEYIPLMIRSIDMATGTLVDPSVGENVIVRNMIAYAMNDTQTRSLHYRQSHEQALELVALLDRALAD